MKGTNLIWIASFVRIEDDAEVRTGPSEIGEERVAQLTWVIGASSLFGYGVMLSDVRVTFQNGATADMLRKAYPVGPYIVAGFAGSVLIGFQLLLSLQKFLYVDPSDPQIDSLAWKPEWVAEGWAPEAKKIFAAALPSEKKLRSHFLMVGVSPETLGSFPRVYIVRFSGPDFRPGFMRKAFTLCHIGSGGGVSLYKRALRDHFRIDASSLRAETGRPEGWAGMLGETVTMVADEQPIQSVSPHMHILVCRLGEISAGTNGKRIYPPDGSEPILFEMPKVATSYDDFINICAGYGYGSEGAVG